MLCPRDPRGPRSLALRLLPAALGAAALAALCLVVPHQPAMSLWAGPQLAPQSVVPSGTRQSMGRHAAGGDDIDDFRRKLMDGAVSGRRFEKWTTKGREAKVMRELMRESANESPEPEEEEFEEFEDDLPGDDPTTADSFTFGGADMERKEMQPANELEDLRSRAFSTWPEKPDFPQRIGAVFLTSLAFLLAIIAVTSDVGVEKVGVAYAVLLSAGITSLFVFRLWSDWNYVGDRLNDKQVFYEKSGWYDGELWAKPPEVAERDRLLYRFQVQPVIDRLRPWLVGSLAATALAFATLLAVRPSDPYAAVPDRSPESELLPAGAKFASYADLELDDEEDQD